MDNLSHTIERRERDEDDAAGLVRPGQPLAVDVCRALFVKPDDLAGSALPFLAAALERFEL